MTNGVGGRHLELIDIGGTILPDVFVESFGEIFGITAIDEGFGYVRSSQRAFAGFGEHGILVYIDSNVL